MGECRLWIDECGLMGVRRRRGEGMGRGNVESLYTRRVEHRYSFAGMREGGELEFLMHRCYGVGVVLSPRAEWWGRGSDGCWTAKVADWPHGPAATLSPHIQRSSLPK